METILDTEQLKELAEELGLEHPDYERLEVYISLVRSYPIASEPNYYRDNLAKWIENEQESYYGEYETAEEFTRDYVNNFADIRVPNWVVLDYAETWRANLRHDFTEDRYHYWADIY